MSQVIPEAAVEAELKRRLALVWEQAYGKGYSDAIWEQGHNARESNPYK